MAGEALNKNARLKWTGLACDGPSTLELDTVTGISLAAGDVVLSTAQAKVGVLEVSVGHAANSIIISAADAALLTPKLYVIVNNDATLATNIKVAGGTAVIIAATKSAIVRIKADGLQILRVTSDI